MFFLMSYLILGKTMPVNSWTLWTQVPPEACWITKNLVKMTHHRHQTAAATVRSKTLDKGVPSAKKSGIATENAKLRTGLAIVSNVLKSE